MAISEQIVPDAENLEWMLRGICMDLTAKNYESLHNEIKPFFGQECESVLDEFFAMSVASHTERAARRPEYYNFNSWAKRVAALFGYVDSFTPIRKVKEIIEGTPKFNVFDLLAERQAIIKTSTSRFTERILNLSGVLYLASPTQFSKVLEDCKKTDKSYSGALNQNL